jgi:two-component sensor histidine kinase
MNLYENKSRWKIYLIITALAIVGITLLVSNYLAGKIAKSEQHKVQLLASAYESLQKAASNANPNSEQQFNLEYEILSSNTDIPIVVLDARGDVYAVANFKDADEHSPVVRQKLAAMRRSGVKPIVIDAPEVGKYYVYYEHTWLLSALRYFPILNFLLIGAFVAVSYLLFSASRRAEQNRVWVGMAKETAHQLGTPITAIMAWIDYLKSNQPDGPTQEVIVELEKDVDRLSLIADRFSKIGSKPELSPENAYDVVRRNFAYMERRAPKRVKFTYPVEEDARDVHNIYINGHLFDWVFENLLRNALDALDGKGEIAADIYADNQYVYIDVSDTGKGIPAAKFKTVFQPGFTTKRRGWGLGLSLAKRIVESYHSGKIFVKQSTVNEGTTFSIQLPKNYTYHNDDKDALYEQ